MDLLRLLAVPPASLFLLTLLGLALLRWRKRLAITLVVIGVLLTYATSTAIVAAPLLRSLQTEPALPVQGDLPRADAIVVLGAGVSREADEFGGITVDRVSLERVRYAAALQRRTGLPVLVTGGPSQAGEPSVAALMADVMEGEFKVKVRWREEQAENTAENASLSAKLLESAGMKRVFVVSHAWHMPRARAAFARTGLTMLAAPTGFRASQDLGIEAFVPSAKAIRESSWAFHEWIGRLFYALGGG